MKIFAYSVREDEEKYFDRFCAAHPGQCAYTSVYPDLANLDLAQGYDAVSIITNVVTKEMYDKLRDMGIRYIATRSVGYDHLDTGYMKQLGIRGVHASYSPNAVANYTIMLMLMACRNVNYILERAAVEDYSLTKKIGKEISLCTVGVIGAGRIGETVIRHLSGFGCRILVNSEFEKDSVKEYAEYVDLDILYRESDIISIHVPGEARNHHMIDEEALRKMKDDVILVNAARGMVVDSEALIKALESGKVGFAALDTFEEEVGLYYKNLEADPLDNPVRDRLRSFPNVILSPHMAFYTEQSTSDMVGTTCEGLLDLERDGESEAEIIYADISRVTAK